MKRKEGEYTYCTQINIWKATQEAENSHDSEERNRVGQAWWLTPVIPGLGRLRQVDHEVKRSRPSWSTW